MSRVSVHVENTLTSLAVDHQHISRLTYSETRELVLQILVFGGKRLRDEVCRWLTEAKIEQIAEVIAPEKEG